MPHETIDCEECGGDGYWECAPHCEECDVNFCSDSCLEEHEYNNHKEFKMNIDELEKAYTDSEHPNNRIPHHYESGKFRLLDKLCEFVIEREKRDQDIEELKDRYKKRDEG